MADDVSEENYVRGKGRKRFRRGDVECDQATQCDRGANPVESTGWTEGSPGVAVALKEAEPSASIVVSTAMSYTGPVAPAAGVNIFPPPASETDLIPEVERAATCMLIVPRTGSPACLPAAPTIATDTLPVAVPAMHFPAGPHTG